MFCIACGNRLPDTAAFCNRCGKATNDAPATEIRATSAVAPPAGVLATVAEPPAAAAEPPVANLRPSEPAVTAPASFAATSPDPAHALPTSDGNSAPPPPPPPPPGGSAYRPPAAGPTAGNFYGSPRPLTFASLRTPAIVLYILLGLFTAVTLFAVAADWRETDLLRQIADRQIVSIDSADQTDKLYAAGKFSQIGLLFLIPAFFVWWTRRAVNNLRPLGLADPKFTPGWAIGWWFIPIANLVQPLRVLDEAWRGSDPTQGGVAGRRTRSGSSILMMCWWVAYVAALIVWPIMIGVRGNALDGDVGHAADVMIGIVALDAVSAAFAALTICVIFALTARQDAANKRIQPGPMASDQFVIGG